MNKDDRRIVKTKRALWEALAKLMLEKELYKITIKELTGKANIHRSTFYTHYEDVYDLYNQLENVVIDGLSTVIIDNQFNSYKSLFKAVVDYVYDNSKSYYMILNKNRNHSFRDRISDFLEKKYLDDWLEETLQGEVKEEWRFLVKYHIHGCLAIVSHWAENNYTYPKNELIDIIYTLNKNFEEKLPE
jgi:hypothetical protein